MQITKCKKSTKLRNPFKRYWRFVISDNFGYVQKNTYEHFVILKKVRHARACLTKPNKYYMIQLELPWISN